MAKSVNQILKEKKQLLSDRTTIESQWQTGHDFFDNVGEDVNTQYTPGTDLTVNQLFDTNSLESADVLASGLSNYLTPATSRWYGLRTKDPLKMEKKRVLHYLKDVEAEVTHTLNNSNFYDVMPNFYKKSGVYGTSILFEEYDAFDMVRFYSVPLNRCCIVEDARGRIVEYHIEFEYTATQAVTRWGPDKVHPEVLKQFMEGRDPNKKAMYTLHIAPNWHRNPMAVDSGNKPWISQWIDDTHMIELERGGFDEQPALTHRFYKRANQPWGFSPAMKALMDVRLLNAKAKTLLRAEMKHVDPPQAMPDNAFLHPYNGNPRGTNYYKKGNLVKDDIFEFGNRGSIVIGRETLEYSNERVRSQMFTDVFKAFDGVTKQMNNPEVFERITEKMTLLGPAVGRFLTVTGNVISRTINILEREGRLPEPPPEMLDSNGEYEIDYLSVLAKAQRNPELNSMQNALTMVANIAQFDPNVIDKIDADKGVDAIFGVTGAPIQMLRDDEEVAEIRANRAEAQAAEQQAAMMGEGAAMAVNATQASKNAQEALALGGGV